MDLRDDEPATCGGLGFFVGLVCCGNQRNGECYGSCAVPERTPCDGCPDCDGPDAPTQEHADGQ